MSLKYFHMIFIFCSIVLAIGFGIWAINYAYRQQNVYYFLSSIMSFVVAIGLCFYEVLVANKLKS
jgi:hypothetical protein